MAASMPAVGRVTVSLRKSINSVTVLTLFVTAVAPTRLLL